MLLYRVHQVSNRVVYRKYSGLANKLVVISGCDSGLGYSLAHSCLKLGSKVLAGCLNIKGPGAEDLRRLGAQVQFLDVTNNDSIEKMVEAASASTGTTLQAVVNNAGVMVLGEFEWQTDSQIRRQIDVNLTGTLHLTQAFLPKLRVDNGRVVNIVSHCALSGLPALAVYGATKAALLNWNDTLRIEQAKYGVRVVSFIPGSFYGHSSIMAEQPRHAEDMLLNMKPDQKLFHLQHFTKVQDYLAQLPRPPRPTIVQDQRLLEKLNHAVLSQSPRSSYKHEPLRYSFYHFLFKIAPTTVRDLLVEYFVKLPKYQSKEK